MNLLGSNKQLIGYNDPFKKDCIDRISIEIGKSPSIFRSNRRCSAQIRFINGTTSGSHDIYNDDFESLMIEVKAFCEGLK